VAFLQKQKKRVKEICKQYNMRTPEVFVFEDKKLLGFYDPQFKHIALNKTLIFEPQEIIDIVIKHELAHYRVDLKYKVEVQTHGKEFNEECRFFGIQTGAKLDVEKKKLNAKSSIKEEKVLNQVQKLFKLAEKTSEKEAQSAILKANELLEKYNLNYIKEEKDLEDIYFSRLVNLKQMSRKWHAISDILSKVFNLYILINRATYSRSGVYLEATGTKENIEIAEYLVDYLDKQFERLWENARKKNNLRGKRAKNSYFMGLSDKFIEANTTRQQETCEETDQDFEEYSKEIAVFNEKISKMAKENVYADNKIRNVSNSYSQDSSSYSQGQNDSGKLNINKAVNKNNKTKLLS